MTSPASSSSCPAWRRALLVLLPLAGLLVADGLIAPHYRLAFNESESLPGTLFLVKVGEVPACGPTAGEPVQLRMPADARWYAGKRLLKVAKGCPGDRVRIEGRDVYVKRWYAGKRLLKVAKGCPGDRVRIEGRDVYVNDWYAGRALPVLNDGTPMEMIASRVIPVGHYYMWASHPASFDSRYAEFDLISGEQIIGTARRLF